MNVTYKGRHDVGEVISLQIIAGRVIVWADFGSYKISAPANFFTLVGVSNATH